MANCVGYLAIEAAHLVQWDVLGATVQVNHFIIWHRLETPELRVSGGLGGEQMPSARAQAAG